MKLFSFLMAVFIMIGCSDNNSKPGEKKLADNVKTTNGTGSSRAQHNSEIVGEWELVGVTGDKNGNGQLEQDERNEASKMKDYMKLNSDGSAEFYTFKTKGSYEIGVDPDSGKKYLDLIDKTNTRHKKGYIMSVSKDELVIMNKFGGDSITIWKRLSV